MIAPAETTAVRAASPADWRDWLGEHSDSADEVWLVIQHVGSATPSVLVREEMSEALCFGWIDSLARKRDPGSFYLRFTPRRPDSRWSRRNRDDAEELISQGRMTGRGLAAIERARQIGTWPTD